MREAKTRGTSVCPWWLAYFAGHRVRRLIQPTGPVVDSLAAPGDSCLDIGCGMGYFTIPLAQRAGPGGHVTAVDLQPRMLEGAAKRARQEGVADWISLQLSGDPGWVAAERYDCILAFWMLHEVPDQAAFLRTLRKVLKTGGRFLLVEPRLHVKERAWEDSLALAEAAGFHVRARLPIKFSRAAMLQ